MAEPDSTLPDSTPPKKKRRGPLGSRSPKSRFYHRAKERQSEALRMVKEGCSLEEIGKKLGYADRSGAWHAVKSALDAIPVAEAEDLRKVFNARFDHLYRSLQRGVKKGHPESVKAAAGITGQQIKLNGVEAPQRVELTGRDGKPVQVATSEIPLTEEQRKARAMEIAKLLQDVGALKPDES
jgi:hypothetical protein